MPIKGLITNVLKLELFEKYKSHKTRDTMFLTWQLHIRQSTDLRLLCNNFHNQFERLRSLIQRKNLLMKYEIANRLYCSNRIPVIITSKQSEEITTSQKPKNLKKITYLVANSLQESAQSTRFKY